MKYRKIKLKSGTEILLGRNAENNDELVKKFKGKKNIILHTSAPGSPFCVIDNLKPSKGDIKQAAVFCSRYSQDWRDNKQEVKIHKFTGKEIRRPIIKKTGTWKIKGKPKIIFAKKSEIEKLENGTNPKNSVRKKRNK